MEKVEKKISSTEEENLKDIIKNMMNDSINYFIENCRVQISQIDTHNVIVIEGWNDSDESRMFLAKYLVAIRGRAIDAALNIQANFINNTCAAKKIMYNSVIKIVGKSKGTLSIKDKSDSRNPWICEALWHLCMTIAKERAEIHPSGEIIGLNYVHVNPKDHGLDGLAIYKNEDTYGVSIAETKGYKDYPSKALTNASKFIKEVIEEKYADEIFEQVQIIRAALPQEEQKHIVDLFWMDERSYMINPHHDSSIKYNWCEKKKSLVKLKVSKEKIIIMPDIIEDYDTFFEQVSDNMRQLVGGYENV